MKKKFWKGFEHCQLYQSKYLAYQGAWDSATVYQMDAFTEHWDFGKKISSLTHDLAESVNKWRNNNSFGKVYIFIC